MARPEPLALLVCDSANVDGQGKPTLHGLFDLVWATRFPTRHPQLSIFFKCRCTRSTAIRVVLTGPDGVPLASTGPIAVEGPGPAQVIHSLVGVEFTQPGEYVVRVLDEEGPLASTAIEVRIRQ